MVAITRWWPRHQGWIRVTQPAGFDSCSFAHNFSSFNVMRDRTWSVRHYRRTSSCALVQMFTLSEVRSIRNDHASRVRQYSRRRSVVKPRCFDHDFCFSLAFNNKFSIQSLLRHVRLRVATACKGKSLQKLKYTNYI